MARGIRGKSAAVTEGQPMFVLRQFRRNRQLERDHAHPTVLILTPVKDAAFELRSYFTRLNALTYPHERISVGFLESDSRDATFEVLSRDATSALQSFHSVGIWKRDFNFHIPKGTPRWAPVLQAARRAVLARSRNHLLARALTDQEWVLWLDVDVDDYPSDLIQRLVETRRTIVHPHCVITYGGETFDKNAWRERGAVHMDQLRGDDVFVELDAVGGTMLWIHADLHRDGLIFPPFPYGLRNERARDGQGEIETEGLGLMAHDMGHVPWGMPNFEVRHRPY
jgi:hypothetical protein